MTLNKGLLWIGTSNIVVPGTKKEYPVAFQAGSRLSYYSSLFNTVELNSPFYKIPLPKTFERWASEVPDTFKFTVKLWKGITHAKKLAFATEDVERFMQAVDHLGDKKGCLLVQFPGSITSDYDDPVERILEQLYSLNPKGEWRIVVELRHASWYHELTYEMMHRYKASLVFHDMPNSRTPPSQEATTTVYLRYHGPKGDYKESYTDAFLHEQAEVIRKWWLQGKEVYVYFNNTVGSALQNVQLLQKLCEHMESKI